MGDDHPAGDGSRDTTVGAAAPAQEPTAVDAAIRARRTSLLVDPERPVPSELVDSLIDTAVWAPNHKRTWPWRFTVLEGAGRSRFGEALSDAAAAHGDDPTKVAKLRTKYCRSATVVLVWTERDANPVRAREDRDATAAATQNLLLAATGRGLGSFWATIADHLVPAAREVASVDDRHDLVAIVYLGWPVGDVPAPERPTPSITRLG